MGLLHPRRSLMPASLRATALALAVASPWPVAGQTRVGAIVGQVVERGTRTGVRDAEVSLRGTAHSSATDSTGSFRLPGLLAGRYTLVVRHLVYGEHAMEVDVAAGVPTTLRVLLTQTAIELDGVSVDVMSEEQYRRRAVGYRQNKVTREQIARAEGTNMTLPDVLRAHVPAVRIRRAERVVGAPICVELRSIRSTSDGTCLSPAVYLDGAPITDPTSLYGTLDVSVIESMEVIPANEAGVRFGHGALYGALLIETRRPGLEQDRGVRARDVFEWSDDPEGHPTLRVALLSTAGNAAGLGIGLIAARQCLHLRAPSYDGLVSDCGVLPTIGAAAAALVFPALGSGWGSRTAGRTARSEGLIAPLAVGSAMAIMPGYALVLSGRRNDSPGLSALGYGLLVIGTPLISTAADYLFRRLRSPAP